MYSFLNDYPTSNANKGYTWNPVGGECKHFCKYCYVKRGRTKNLKKYMGEVRLDEKCMKDNLGNGNYIFVGSATDIFGDWVPDEIIKQVLDYCKKFDNKYLFQTKNPIRFFSFFDKFPHRSVLGCTIESNISYPHVSSAPDNGFRILAMSCVKGFEKMISIEPIMQFTLKDFVDKIKYINPSFVSIGADSKNCGLPEPESHKIEKLIKELKKFTDVKIKSNLSRIIGDE